MTSSRCAKRPQAAFMAHERKFSEWNMILADVAQSPALQGSSGRGAMRSSKCGAENPDRAKFCIECASPPARRCLSCGAENTQTIKFWLDAKLVTVELRPASVHRWASQ